jgi:hypothetical protein
LLSGGERYHLPVGAVDDAGDLAADEFGGGRDRGANGVDERVVEDAVLVAGPLLDQAPATRDP